VQTAASAAATAQQAAQTATTAAQTATAAEKGVPLLDEATVAAIRAQVQAQYLGWNPDRMTMDYQPGDELFSRLLREAAAQTATTTATTGAPAMPQLPANLGTMTEAQKIAWYRATLAAGFTNEAIRAAVEAVYGRQSDSDWTYLRAKAAQTAAQTAAPAGGAGLLVAAAAAAYFLLG